MNVLSLKGFSNHPPPAAAAKLILGIVTLRHHKCNEFRHLHIHNHNRTEKAVKTRNNRYHSTTNCSRLHKNLITAYSTALVVILLQDNFVFRN